MDPIQGNPAAQTEGSVNTNATGEGIEKIMGSMAEGSTPEAKPEQGIKAEGKETAAAVKDEEAPPAWTSQLPEDIRSNADAMKQLVKFQKIGDLAKSYSELEAKLGNSIVKPGDNSSDEEKESFYRKLGKPEKASDYEFDGEDKYGMKEAAYENNLTKEQAKNIYAKLKSIGENELLKRERQMQIMAHTTDQAMKAEYGQQYEAKLEMLRRGVQAYGGETLGVKLKNSGLLYDPAIVKMFITLGEMNAEAGTFNKGNPGGSGYKATSEGGSFTFKGLK